MKRSPERRIVSIAAALFALDQLTKWIVVHRLPLGREVEVIPGFFRWVHWGNTGAAWSLFHDNNHLLAAVSALALVVLFIARHYFEAHTRPGQVALGLILGGIAGNLLDRIVHRHVVDFIYFHLHRRDGVELGFPAFNIADTAICTGVGIVFLLSWRSHPDSHQPPNATAPPPSHPAP
ncbi:MAG: signal peptidase II [Verrucomicrobiae bacterium]|nr:signal peptidase II [Verrucomicrobiae bacterium]